MGPASGCCGEAAFAGGASSPQDGDRDLLADDLLADLLLADEDRDLAADLLAADLLRGRRRGVPMRGGESSHALSPYELRSALAAATLVRSSARHGGGTAC